MLGLVGVLGVVAALTLGGAELVVRHREWNRSATPGIMPTLYYRHSRLRHALVRNYSYFGWFGTDSAGFRRTDNGRGPPGGRPVILVLGESTTFDTSVSPDSSAWPARLETWMRAEGSVWPGVVLNGGVSGYTVVDNLIRLETDLADVRPDVLVIYHGHNDLYATLVRAVSSSTAYGQRPGQAETVTPWWLEEHSLLYAKGGGPGPGHAVDWNAIVEAGASRFARDVESLIAVAGVRGIPVVLT